MAYSKDARQQLGNISPNRIVKALKADNWDHQFTKSARQAYVKSGRRVTIHVHPKPYRSISLIEDILCRQIGWAEEDLIRLGFLKGKQFKKKQKDKTKKPPPHTK
jgi:predicted RNA binding protein YcfA (HicA-like mRNA interferase family)